MSEQDASGRIDEDQASAPVGDQIHEAKSAHEEQARQDPATEGHGVEPEGTGYAPPDPGAGEQAESEIPEGVEALTDEQIQAAEERGGGGGDEGDGGALDVSEIMAEAGGDADAEGGDEDAT